MPGATIPLLALAAIHRQLDDVTVGAMKRLVLVQQRLHAVRAGRHVREALDAGSRARRRRSRRSSPGCQPVDVDAEDLLRLRAVVDLEPRLFAGSFESMSISRPADSVPPSFASYLTANRGVANAEAESTSSSEESSTGRMMGPLGNGVLR